MSTIYYKYPHCPTAYTIEGADVNTVYYKYPHSPTAHNVHTLCTNVEGRTEQPRYPTGTSNDSGIYEDLSQQFIMELWGLSSRRLTEIINLKSCVCNSGFRWTEKCSASMGHRTLCVVSFTDPPPPCFNLASALL